MQEVCVPISVREAVKMMSSEKVLAKSMVPSWPHLEKKSCSGDSHILAFTFQTCGQLSAHQFRHMANSVLVTQAKACHDKTHLA